MQEEELGVGACDEAGYVIVEELVNDLEIPILERQRQFFFYSPLNTDFSSSLLHSWISILFLSPCLLHSWV